MKISNLRLAMGTLLACFAGEIGHGAVVTPPLSSTPYTRRFLTNLTAVGAINSLGISQTNAYGFATEQFSVTGSNVAIKAAAPLTNAVMTAPAITGGTVSNAAWLYTNTVYVVPSASATLSNLISAAPNNSTVVLLPGTHVTLGMQLFFNNDNGSINIENKTNFTLKGMGSALWMFPTGQTCISIQNSKGIALEDFALTTDKSWANFYALGANSPSNRLRGNSFGAIEIAMSEDVAIRRVSISNVYGGGIFGSWYLTTWPSTNQILVENCSIQGCGSITDIGNQGAGIWPSGGWIVRDNKIRECMRGIYCLYYDYAAAPLPTPPVRILRNDVQDCYEAGISVRAFSHSAVIAGNGVSRPTNNLNLFLMPGDNSVGNIGIQVFDGNAATVENNLVTGHRFGLYYSGFVVPASTNMIMSGNTFRNVGHYTVVMDQNMFGFRASGNQFIDVGNHVYLMGSSGGGRWLLNSSVTDERVRGWDMNQFGGAFFCSKFSQLVSNVWFDKIFGDFGQAPGAGTIGLDLSTAGVAATNLYIGQVEFVNVSTNLSTVAAVPIYTDGRFIISTNYINPPVTTTGGSWTTNISTGPCSLAESNDAVWVSMPPSWPSAWGNTNASVSGWASNRAVIVTFANQGTNATIDPPGDWMRITIQKLPAMWPWNK